MVYASDALTNQRYALAQTIRDALPNGYGVWAYPPANLTLPGVFLALAGGEPSSVRGDYRVTYRIVIAGPGGDNDGTLTALESSLLTVLAALRAAYGNKPRWEDPDWDEPARATIGGQSALTVELALRLPLMATPSSRMKAEG